jgi:hypothetical protein
MSKTSSRVPRRIIRTVDDLSKIERLMLVHVCRYRMTMRRGWRGAWELRDYSGIAWGRFVDPSGSGVCHMLFVDGSLQTSPNRVAQRVRPQILKLTDSSYWVEEIRQGQTGTAEVREEDEADHFDYGSMPKEKWSTHQSSEGITFFVVTEPSGPFVSVLMPGE